MRAVGIITEYNPFHKGHIIHIEESRKKSGADVVVCVMSSDFVQRGEPAITDKFSRAKMAVLGGVDLVVELPVSASLSSAEGFAEASVKHLNALGVSSICFGSENSNISALSDIADILVDEPPLFKDTLKSRLEKGESYASARQKAVAACTGSDTAAVLEKPNNVLGIEYIKAIKSSRLNINPLCIQRVGAGYNDTDLYSSHIQSASAIRRAYESGMINDIDIPEFTKKILDEIQWFPITFNHFSQMFYYRIEMLLNAFDYDKSAFVKELSKYKDLSEETASRIYSVFADMSASDKMYTLEEFALAVKTKQFALSRIKRNIMRLILDIDDAENRGSTNIAGNGCESVNYLRVLGFNKKGQEYLSMQKDRTDIPIITNAARQKQIYAKEIHAHNIYRQICLNTYKTAPESDYTGRPFIF